MGLVHQSKYDSILPPQSKKFDVGLKNKLEEQEVALILTLIKHSTFKGEDLETIYNLVVKLQNQLRDVQS